MSVAIPLLHDWHTHPLLYATLMDGINLGREPAPSREEAVALVRARARAGGDAWTIAYGWNTGRYALAAADFAGLPPVVVLNLSLHGLVVNAAGLDLLRHADPEAADRVTDQGWFERNLRRVLNLFAGAGASAARLRRFYDRLLAEHGVFAAEEMLLAGAEEIGLFDEAGLAGRTRFWAAPETYDALPPALQARVHGIKLFTDGALGTWSAALARPYRGTARSGLLLHGDAELAALVGRYAGAGKPVAVHAIGDRAIDQVVAVAAAVRPSAAGEIRIEHAQFISEATARRAKDLGLTLSMQPNFSDDSLCYLDRLSDGYAARNNPFRMLIDRAGFVPGADLLLGSDGMPHGVREALRQALFPPHAGQALTLDEFVAGYCVADTGPGRVEVETDRAAQRVTCRVALAPAS